MTKAFHLLPLLCLLAFLPTHAATAQQAATQNVLATATLDLSSPDGRHVTLTADALQSLPRQTVRVHNPHSNADEAYQGVELSLLLARLDAPLGAKLRGKGLAMYIVAEGTDKYSAVYSLAEVDPAFHGGTVIVADRMDDQPLGAKDGPFKLVNTEDKRPARWVRNLASLQLRAP